MKDNSAESKNFEYELIPILHTPNIDPGEKVKMSFHVTGKPAKPKQLNSKLYVNVSNIGLGNSPTIIKTYRRKYTDDGGVVIGTGEEYTHATNIPQDFGDAIVTPADGLLLANQELQAPGYDAIYGEVGGQNLISVEFEIPNETHAGNYDLHSSLVYGTENEVKGISHKISTLHVKNWRERHRKKLWILGAILIPALLTFGVALFTRYILPWIESILQSF